jgi:hypothetical protein
MPKTKTAWTRLILLAILEKYWKLTSPSMSIAKISLVICSLGWGLIGCGAAVSNPTQVAAPIAAPVDSSADRATTIAASPPTVPSPSDKTPPATVVPSDTSEPSSGFLIDSEGNYYTTPKKRGLNSTWKVVDPDPQGLNCRMPRRFNGKYFDDRVDSRVERSDQDYADSVMEAILLDKTPDIGSWDVTTTIPQGKIIRAFGQVGVRIQYDAQGQTWLPVYFSPNDRPISVKNPAINCFVRANQKFIQFQGVDR